MRTAPDILVVGAGPTGLALALVAAAHGARVRLIDRRPESFRPSRAMLLHTRTLEVLRPYGVAEALVSCADTDPAVRLRLGSREVSVRLGELDLPDTAFPHLSLVRQGDVEAVLGRALRERSIPVERGVRLAALRCADAAIALLSTPTGLSEVACRYVAGCDGAGSTVRRSAGIDWRGAMYRQEVVLADIEVAGDLSPGQAHVVAGRSGLLFLFPLGERATWRLLATRDASAGASPGQDGPPLPIEELQSLVAASGATVRVAAVRWSTRLRLQHRLARRYRQGPVFLAGDAAHVHSPAGGQGMNVGIQDAVNLGWKLAYAPDSRAPEELLDSYERERRPVARHTMALTDIAFWGESATDPVASTLRAVVAPLAAPAMAGLLRRRGVVGQGVRVLSQLRVGYRASPLSVQAGAGPRGWPRPGDRLPDATVVVAGRSRRLHELTGRPGVHVLLERDAGEPAGLGRPRVLVHRLTDVPGGGVVVARPDGYVGFRGGHLEEAPLRRWLDRIGA